MKKKFKIFTLFFLIISLFAGCISKESPNNDSLSKKEFKERVKREDIRKNRYPEIDAYLEKNKEKSNKAEKKEEKAKKAKLLFGGDVLPHMPINDYAYYYGDGDYDYSRSFEDINDFAKDFDFFMVNNEFTVNPSLEVSGYPLFNSNKNIYKAMKDAGIDLVTTANNHCLDTGIDGLVTTIEAIESFDIDHVGTSKSSYKPYIIKDVKGIKIGILSYAENLNGNDYLLDTDEKYNMVNTLDRDQVKKDLAKLKKKDVDFIVVYPHWGVEYESYPESYQIEFAHDMLEWGADMVIGNHPHVIQPMEEYETEDGRKGLIYYSLGNLLSNQKQEAFEGDYRVEQGLLIETNIEKKPGERAKIISYKNHSTCVDRSFDEFGYLDKTYVATPYLEDEDKLYGLEERIRYLIELSKQMNEETLSSMGY